MLGGPVLLFEAVRTARRTRLALLRALYALLLLVVLFVVYTRWFGRDLTAGLTGVVDERALPPSELARFAASFFHSGARSTIRGCGTTAIGSWERWRGR
jgi:hypothetical protein